MEGQFYQPSLNSLKLLLNSTTSGRFTFLLGYFELANQAS